MISQQHKILCLGLIVFSVILYAYSPIFWLDFAYHNDYRLCEYHHQHIFSGFPETRHLIAIGRPLLSILLNAQVWLINDMHAFHIAHIFSILSIAIFAAMYFYYAQKWFDISPIGAAMLAILTFTLPSMAINSFWVLNYVSSICGALIAFFSYILMQKMNFKQRSHVLVFLSVGFLLYLDLLIYPPSVFFFLTISFIKILFGPKNSHEKLQQVFREICITLIVSLIYYISIRFILKPFLLTHPEFMYQTLKGLNWQSYYQLIDNTFPQYSWETKTILFFDKWIQIKEYFVLTLSAWFAPLNSVLITFIGCLFLGCLSWAAYQSTLLSEFSTLTRVILGLVLLIVIAILTALPILAGSSYYVIHYRVTFASMAIVPAVFIFAYERVLRSYGHRRWSILIYLFTIMFFSLAEMHALHRIILVTQRNHQEYQWVSVYLKQHISEKTKKIYIQLPIADRPDSRYLHADFGFNASDLGMRGLVRAALSDMKKNPDDYHILFDTSEPQNSDELLWIHALPIIKRQLSPTLLVGKWSAYDRPANIKYINNQLIINVFGENEEAFISHDNYFLSVPNWNNLQATLSENGQELRWLNGFTLEREMDNR